MCKHDYCQTLLVFIALIMSLQPTLSRAQVPGDLPALTVLVRHAERASSPADDPPLTPAGIKRAQDLAATLRDTRFSAIVTTHLIRTRDTAAPTATALGLMPENVIVKDLPPDAHAKAIENAVRKHRGGVVLVVNHSNVLAAIIARLGGPQFPNICETVYDHLFALIPAAGRVQFVSSRYGDVSPPPQPGCM